MEFGPANPVIRLCLLGIAFEEKGDIGEARKTFVQAWNEATDDQERFIVAHFVARQQPDVADKLSWLERAFQLSLRIQPEFVQAAMRSLHLSIAKCYQELHDSDSADRHIQSAVYISERPLDHGPFYHGTRADLRIGDLLVPGFGSNYQKGLKMNHIYFTALIHGAGLAASLANGAAAERVYIVEPTGSFEDDPNVTNMKFPGNPTRSYRTQEPLTIVGEVEDWSKQAPEELDKWRKKVANTSGRIIN